jgi:hypothetical protein
MASTRSRSRSPSHEHDYDLDSILSSSKPAIDLHLPAYEASVTNFSRAIANFTARSVAEITQRRDAHDKALKRLDVRAQDIEKETENCKLKEIELIARCVILSFVTFRMLSYPTEQSSNTNARRQKRQNPQSPLSAVVSNPNAR